MLFLLIHHFSYSQHANTVQRPPLTIDQPQFRIDKPHTRAPKTNKHTADSVSGKFPFSLKGLPVKSGVDTAYRTVLLKLNSRKIVAYRMEIIRDSVSSITVAKDSMLFDSVLHHLVFQSDSLFQTEGFNMLLINASDIEMEYPIEGIYQSQRVIVKPPSITATVMDSLKKTKPVRLNGSIQTIGQLSEDRLPYQSVPQNFVRTYTQLNAEVYGLPFSSGYYYTTEGNQGANKISNFRLSFNYQQFYTNVRRKLDKKIELGKTKQLKSMTPIDIAALTQEYTKLRKEFDSKDYQKKLQRNQEVLDYALKDTSFVHSYKYKRALAKQNLNNDKLDRFKELERLKEEYLSYRKQADLDAQVATFNLDKPADFRKAAKRYKVMPPSQQIFLSIRKLDLGTFDPDYTTLVLSGVNLTGVNVEVNPGKLYGAFTWGKAVANFNNPFDLSAIAGGRNIVAGRVGYGNKDNLLVAVSILKGTDDSGNIVKDSVYDYYLPNHNYVLGVDAKYIISPDAEVGVEYAKSQQKAIGSDPSTSGELKSLATPNWEKYSSAFYAYSTVQFNQQTSKLKFATRVIDPFYYSFGTPYLRKDNFRIEAKGEQVFWERQVSMSLTYRRDADNIYELKQGTSSTNTFLYNLSLRVKKYPYLIVLYSPNYQSLYHASFNKQLTTEVKFYNVIVGYSTTAKNWVSNSMVSFTKQYNTSNQPEWKRYHVNQFALSQSIQFKPIYLILTGAGNYSLPILTNDTGKSVSASLNATKGVFKNKATVTIGSRYQKDLLLEQRLVAEVGSSFALGFGIQCQVQLERHFVTSYSSSVSSTDMTLGRITIIKTFSYE